jgi:hypothetical protein
VHSSHFKNKTPWFFVIRHPHLTWGYNMMWSFFSIGHGKRPHDGATVVLKRFIRKSQLDVNGRKLQNVKDVITLMCTHLFSWLETSYVGERKLVTCVFWHFKTTNVDHHTKYICDYVKGSRDLHCVKFVNIQNVEKWFVLFLLFLFGFWLQELCESSLDPCMANKGLGY